METKTYIGESGTTAFDGYKGLRMRQRYTGSRLSLFGIPGESCLAFFYIPCTAGRS